MLRRLTAAPFHMILWDNQPVRLSDALGQIDLDPDDTYYYTTRGCVYSISGANGASGANGTAGASGTAGTNGAVPRPAKALANGRLAGPVKARR